MRARFLQGSDYQTWLLSELGLFGLLAGGSAALAGSGALQTAYELPELRLFIRTTIMLTGFVMALLAGARAAVEGRRSDVLLSCGFFAGALGTAAFTVAPTLGGQAVAAPEAWADIGARLVAAGLVATSALVSGTRQRPGRALLVSLAAVGILLAVCWGVARSLAPALPPLVATEEPPAALVVALAL